MPITSEPAPSLRPWASATGATPLRTMFNLTCPPKCWVKIGHFYFAGNRTFLLCLDIVLLHSDSFRFLVGQAVSRVP